MKSKAPWFVLLAVAAGVALAQTANPFLGQWKVTWMGQERELEAELVVTEAGGNWKTFANTRKDPCVGREVPIATESSTADTATIRLKFSETIPGCTDSVIRLKLLDANKATGTRGKAELTLTKK